jgi:soluble lytic murein transglycosylase-like protein
MSQMPIVESGWAQRCRAVALCWLAVGCAQQACAQIVVKDAGDGAVVFSNLDTLADAPERPQAARAAAAAVSPKPRDSARRKDSLMPLVRAAARTHGLPEALLQAVVETESGFDPAAVSPKGALGLMQLMPQTARALQVRDARDPAANIDGGARYLKELLSRFRNDLALALAAYNAGPGAVERSGGIPRIAETQAYVPRVIARYHHLQSGAH